VKVEVVEVGVVAAAVEGETKVPGCRHLVGSEKSTARKSSFERTSVSLHVKTLITGTVRPIVRRLRSASESAVFHLPRAERV